MVIDGEKYIRARVEIDPSGCWLWTRCRNKYGYGQCTFLGRWWKAHRLSYETFVGPIPEGLEIDHLCRVRHCLNPEHLELVTHKENILRGDGWGGQHIRKTHCKNGHPFNAENTKIRKNGWRICRTCMRDLSREHKRRVRAA